MPPICSICGTPHELRLGLFHRFTVPKCRCDEAAYWSCEEDAEILTAEDHNDAIEFYLDQHGQKAGKLTIYGYKTQSLPKNALSTDYILEWSLEVLDEEYGNPNEATEPNAAMIEAAKVFAAAICDNYKVWTCDVIQTAEIDIAEWIARERPDWQEETDGTS